MQGAFPDSTVYTFDDFRYTLLMTALRIVIRGRVERGEFGIPLRRTTEMLEKIGVQYHINPATNDEQTDFVLFFQSYPHEFLPEYLSHLRQNHPFAPFFFVLGVCCGGMLRTARPLDSPFYCYAHEWIDWEIDQIRRFLTDQSSLFALPLTVENDEIALWRETDGRRHTADGIRFGDTVTGSLLPSLILTHFGPFGNDSAMNLLIADEQHQQGHEPIFSGRMLPESFSGNIFADADDSPPEIILESIQRLRRRFVDNDFAVYIDSPRINEKIDYTRAGVTRILPKIRQGGRSSEYRSQETECPAS